MTDTDKLEEEQRPAHLIFWYESEVQNGGHLQYFLNRGEELVPETIKCLRAAGADCFASILAKAMAIWELEADAIAVPSSVEEYVMSPLQRQLEGVDAEFGRCPSNLITVLEGILAQQQDLFVIVE